MKIEGVDLLENQADEVSRLLASLAHPVRLKVLCLLLKGEASVGALVRECKTSQSSMSQFLTRMKDEGLLQSERRGHFMYYGIAEPRLLKLMKSLKQIYCS